MTSVPKKIGIIGGSGALGAGLAKRWAKSGYQVVVGSRDDAKAQLAAQKLNEEANVNSIIGKENKLAAAEADLVVLTVPFSNQIPSLELIKEELTGKILIDVTVPIDPPKDRTVQVHNGRSSAKAAKEIVADEENVVSAFQNVAATHLDDLDHTIDCDVLVCGYVTAAREVVVQLAADAVMIAWHAGVIANSIVAEAMTSTLIFMNNRYKIDGAGLKITGTPGSAS